MMRSILPRPVVIPSPRTTSQQFLRVMYTATTKATKSPSDPPRQPRPTTGFTDKHLLPNPPVTTTLHRRRIIIASDGTGKSSTRGSPSVASNVSRFLRALTPSCPATGTQQISLYQSGVGTGSLGSLLLSPLTGGVGLGLDDNVLDAYMFVANNHIPGDEISLFGFSRGAFTVRVLAGLIRTLGLFKKEYLWELKRAYNAYKLGREAFATYVKDSHSAAKRGRTRHVSIKCVGCWDTVGSMGLPGYDWVKLSGWNEAFEYYDPKLTLGVENAFHCLAIDEIRHPFTPTLFHLPRDASLKDINLHQCWFPGVHTNVGGGYADQNLADLTLAWMVDKCRPFLSFNNSYIDLCVKLNHHPKSIRSKLREQAGFDKEYRGWARGRVYESYQGLSKWLWHRVRTPGEYEDGGITDEKMHRSVRERWEKDGSWRPSSLDGFTPQEADDGKWRWVKRQTGRRDIVIPEEDFTEDKDSFEHKLRFSPA